jgi:hypothetical protein
MILSCHALNATSNKEYWQKYVQGHAQVLHDFGVDVLDSYGDEWAENPNVRLIIAEDEEGNAVGGIKLHKVHPNYLLPVQQAIGEESPQLNVLIDKYSPEGVGEICGLWISNKVGKRGLAYFLTRVAIAICEAEGITVIFGISSPFTLHMFQSLGYEVMRELGDNGNYFYPTQEFLSTAVAIYDAINLPLAEKDHRARVLSLRNEPIQSALERHGDAQTFIHYNLSQIIS